MGKVIKGYKYRGEWREKEVEDEYSLYKSDVVNLIGKEHWKEFSKWMRGQGCPVMSDKTIGYFKWDVEQFIEEELTWHTLDGRKLQLKDIEHDHLVNIKKHLEERIKSSQKWLDKIKRQLKSKGL